MAPSACERGQRAGDILLAEDHEIGEGSDRAPGPRRAVAARACLDHGPGLGELIGTGCREDIMIDVALQDRRVVADIRPKDRVAAEVDPRRVAGSAGALAERDAAVDVVLEVRQRLDEGDHRPDFIVTQLGRPAGHRAIFDAVLEDPENLLVVQVLDLCRQIRRTRSHRQCDRVLASPRRAVAVGADIGVVRRPERDSVRAVEVGGRRQIARMERHRPAEDKVQELRP